MLEQWDHWKMSETRVVVMGGRQDVKNVLLHHSFRNTVHALYFAIHPNTYLTSLHRSRLFSPFTTPDTLLMPEMWVYRRCLFCNRGKAHFQYLFHWKLNTIGFKNHQYELSQLYSEDHFYNFWGHQIKFVTARYFPYVNYIPDTDEPFTTVTPTDSLDVRMIKIFARKMNFTYVLHEEPNRSWGVEKDGVYDGLLGYVQREEVDMCTVVAPSPNRLKAALFFRCYPADPLTVVSLKPQPLPKYLALVRPFTGTVWVAILMSVLVWGMTLWLLQQAWSYVTGIHSIQFIDALLYGWGALLEVPPPDRTKGFSGQILVGWWLLFCVVIFTAFESSLISHLTVNKARTKPPETFEDLVNTDGWSWGLEHWMNDGAIFDYFYTHTDSVVQKVYKEKQLVSLDEGLVKIMKGHNSLIAYKYYITMFAVDEYGNSNFFISNNGIYIMAFFGWGFRLGAPYYHRFHKLTLQLDSAGLPTFWLWELISQQIKKTRESAKQDKDFLNFEIKKDESAEVVLGLEHLQGAFYLLIFGFSAAVFTLLGENLSLFYIKKE